jgi:phage-related holin
LEKIGKVFDKSEYNNNIYVKMVWLGVKIKLSILAEMFVSHWIPKVVNSKVPLFFISNTIAC